MINSLKKAFNGYSRKPFLFVWAAFLYIFILITFFLAAIGIFLSYFMTLSVFDQELNLEAISTLAVLGILVVLLLFFFNGINAALARAYDKALARKKTSLTAFYSYALDKAPTMFIIMLIREFIWLLVVGPAIAIYIYFLEGYEFMDLLVGFYGLSMTFIVHMLFTPSFILAGAFDGDLYSSLKHGFEFLRKRHIFFIATYIIFAFAWLLNFIPFLQVISIFFLYPIVYGAMIIMIKNTIRIEGEEDE